MRTRLVVLLLIATARPAAAERPSEVAMGVSATLDGAPFSSVMLGLPVSIEAGTVVDGELWWHATASFGLSVVPGDEGEGHDVGLTTGPRIHHCWTRTCGSVGIELGWGRSRWTYQDNLTFSYDHVDAEARARLAFPLTDSGLVLLELSGGPRTRYYVDIDTGHGPTITRGVGGGLALVVRN